MKIVQIPTSLISEDLWNAPADELAFLLNFGHKIYDRVEQVHIQNAQLQTEIAPQEIYTLRGGPAALIGQNGEEYVSKIYEQCYVVENVAKQGRAGDLFIWRSDPETLEPAKGKILIEVKNYQTTIGSEQVEKFYRDLTANSAISGGIFISLNTKIAGVQSQFHFVRRNNRPIVFVTSSEESVILLAAQLAWSFIDSRTVVDQDVFHKLSRKLTDFNNTLNNLSLARTFVTETRSIMDKQLSRVYETILTGELQMRNSLTSISRTLAKFTGSYDNENSAEFDWNQLDVLEKQIMEKYPKIMFSTDKDHRTLVKALIEEFALTCSDEFQYRLLFDKKGIAIGRRAAESPTEIVLGLTFLKSRTDLKIRPHVTGDSLNLPTFANYKDSMVCLAIDKKYTKSGDHEKVIAWIQSL